MTGWQMLHHLKVNSIIKTGIITSDLSHGKAIGKSAPPFALNTPRVEQIEQIRFISARCALSVFTFAVFVPD